MQIQDIQGLSVALGIGLLIGIERERRKGEGANRAMAGVRSFTLLCLLGAVSQLVDPIALLVVMLGVGLLVAVSYRRSSRLDPGITTEVTALLTVMLGALAMREPGLATALGVVVAVLLDAKAQMHRFSRDLIGDDEVRDGLLLAASALVVLPLLPNEAIGPLQIFNPWKLWLLVVLAMAIGALGHVLLRLFGARWGVVLAGFVAGFISSTAATAEFGRRARAAPEQTKAAVSAALMASAASLLLFVPLLGAVSPQFLLHIAPALATGLAVLLTAGLLGIRSGIVDVAAETGKRRMFRFRDALLFAVAVSVILMVSAALNAWLGPRAVLAGTTIAALAEAHAAGLSLGQLEASGSITQSVAVWGFLGLLLASSVSKTIIAWLSGGRAYGLRIGAALLTMTVFAGSAVALQTALTNG